MPMDRLAVSACYLVCNEEEFLESSIQSIAPWVQELVIMDTGSDDATEEISKSFKNKVPKFIWNTMPWKDHFAEARNKVAKLATCPWVLFIDGDEVLDEKAYALIQPVLDSKDIACFSFIQRNYTHDQSLEKVLPAQTTLPPGLQSKEKLFCLENTMERLYRKNLGISYQGRIHESLIPSCKQLGLKWGNLPVILHHYGRLKKTAASKAIYYLKLSESKWKEEPESVVSWIEFLIALMENQEFKRAFEIAKQAFPKFESVPQLLEVAYQSALRADENSQAEKWIQKVLKLTPKNHYARSQLTTAVLYQGRLEESLQLAKEVLKESPDDFVCHINCSVVFFERKDWQNAARHLKAAQKIRPKDLFIQRALEKIPAEFQNY